MRIVLTVIATLLLPALGCTPVDDDLPKTVNASGTITLDGSPVAGASIVIMQEGGENRFAHGVSDSSGRFSLKAFETKDGAVPGQYKATVSKTVEVAGKSAPKSVQSDALAAGGETASNVSWKNDLPNKYNSPVTSGLSVTVPDNGVSDLSIELKSK